MGLLVSERLAMLALEGARTIEGTFKEDLLWVDSFFDRWTSESQAPHRRDEDEGHCWQAMIAGPISHNWHLGSWLCKINANFERKWQRNIVNILDASIGYSRFCISQAANCSGSTRIRLRGRFGEWCHWDTRLNTTGIRNLTKQDIKMNIQDKIVKGLMDDWIP